LVIIPTYNESQNVERLLPLVLEQDERVEVLVVDDNSPDGTADLVEKLSALQPRIHLIKRAGKMGLGTAYIAGFKFALETGYDWVMGIDADFSHDPREIPNFIALSEEADFIQGSRYLNGVNVINWPMSRLLLSYGANIYSQWVIGLPVKDATGAFRMIKRQVLENINLDRIKSNGYSFQIEMLFYAWRKGFKIKEIPIVFVERMKGKSKLSRNIVWEAAFMVWRLRIKSILGLI
jgi:dolichol-phosphate mannosyltransferase